MLMIFLKKNLFLILKKLEIVIVCGYIVNICIKEIEFIR